MRRHSGCASRSTRCDALASSTPAVIALGRRRGRLPTRSAKTLRQRALTVLVEVEPEEAWRRVRGGDRPLAQDEAAFRTLYEQRRPLYDDVADARVQDLDGGRARRRRRPRRDGVARATRRADRRRRPGRADQRRAGRRDLRHGRPARARSASAREPRAPARRAGEERRVAGGALARAAPRTWRHPRRARRRLHDGRRGLRRRDVPPRDRLGGGADDARRPGRRGDRRQDGDRPAGREEPGRRLPLARADGDRPGDARDAAGGRARERARRGGQDRPARRRAALGAAPARAGAPLRGVQDRGLPARPARPRRPQPAEPRSHVRARARGRRRLRAAARPRRRARAARRAAALRPRHVGGRGDPSPGAGQGRPRARLGGAGPRQEGRRRRPAPRPARGAGPAVCSESSAPRPRCERRSIR